jgi:hypothetical protein
MLLQKRIGSAVWIAAFVLGAGTATGTAFAQKLGTPVALKPEDKLAQAQVKQLLVLIGEDNDGKVSREDFLKFMDAEFARLDKYRSGLVDAREIANTRPVSVHRKGD